MTNNGLEEELENILSQRDNFVPKEGLVSRIKRNLGKIMVIGLVGTAFGIGSYAYFSKDDNQQKIQAPGQYEEKVVKTNQKGEPQESIQVQDPEPKQKIDFDPTPDISFMITGQQFTNAYRCNPQVVQGAFYDLINSRSGGNNLTITRITREDSNAFVKRLTDGNVSTKVGISFVNFNNPNENAEIKGVYMKRWSDGTNNFEFQVDSPTLTGNFSIETKNDAAAGQFTKSFSPACAPMGVQLWKNFYTQPPIQAPGPTGPTYFYIANGDLIGNGDCQIKTFYPGTTLRLSQATWELRLFQGGDEPSRKK